MHRRVGSADDCLGGCHRSRPGNCRTSTWRTIGSFALGASTKEVSSVVFIITGTTESGRNTVGKRLAETLGWEFVDAENLKHPGDSDLLRRSTSAATADPEPRLQILSAAIEFWIYEWRDVVVSCPMSTGKELRRLSTISRPIKIVCLEPSRATDREAVFDRSAGVMTSESSIGWQASPEPGQKVLALDSSQQVEEIIGEIAAVLTTRKSA